MLRRFAAASVLTLIGGLALEGAFAQPPARMGRQYYTPWKFDKAKGRWATTYYYKANPRARDYHYLYMYHYPKRGNWAYFYNPGFGGAKGGYWGKKGYFGRCAMGDAGGGKNPYQYLYTDAAAAKLGKPGDRTSYDKELDKIDPDLFGKGEPMPFIPETDGPDRMEPPPNLAAGEGQAPPKKP
jgi:hypothetical protein